MGKLVTVVASIIVLAALAFGAWKLFDHYNDPLSRYAGRLDALKPVFRDPDSVKFKDVYIGKLDYLCGSVNARNGMGGYTGFQVFYAMPGVPYAVVIDSDWASPDQKTQQGSTNHALYSTWQTNCTNLGK